MLDINEQINIAQESWEDYGRIRNDDTFKRVIEPVIAEIDRSESGRAADEQAKKCLAILGRMQLAVARNEPIAIKDKEELRDWERNARTSKAIWEYTQTVQFAVGEWARKPCDPLEISYLDELVGGIRPREAHMNKFVSGFRYLLAVADNINHTLDRIERIASPTKHGPSR